VLITGGAGFIGSTVASACLDAGIEPVILDDLSTGRAEFAEGRAFYEGDIADGALVDALLAAHPDISVVIHCAAKTVVPDSVAAPLHYYRSNVGKTLELLRSLARNGVARVVFSSSASVYAPEEVGAVTEESALGPSSPYARTKAMIEQILADSAAAGEFRAIALRYFNPIGADPAFRTGLQHAEPTHALGLLISAHRRGDVFTVTGTDWPTRDGSGLRDFIHVWDLARAHVRAIERFDQVTAADPFCVLNLGGGRGTTVKELVAAFERVSGSAVKVGSGPRRPGDVAGAYADATRAAQLLDWRAELTVEDGIRDSLDWAGRFADRS
jgi:UDP-glucose 4-epimerase